MRTGYGKYRPSERQQLGGNDWMLGIERRFVAGVGLGLLLLAMTGCISAPWRYSAEPIEGRIIDKETRAPIEGVVVVAQWILQRPPEGHEAERWVVIEAVTDVEGRYKIPGWGPKWRPWWRWLEAADPMLELFKPGYWPRGLYNHHPESGSLQSINPDDATVRKSFWNGKKIELWPFKIGVELQKQFDTKHGHAYPLDHILTAKEWVDQINFTQNNVDWGGLGGSWSEEDWLKIKNLVQMIDKECSKLPNEQRIRLHRVPEKYKSVLFGEKEQTCL